MSARKRSGKKRPSTRNFWLAWASANAIAWTVGFGLAQIYARLFYGDDRFIQLVLEEASFIWTRPLGSLLATANFGLLLGASVGLGQWLILRRRFDIKWQSWMVATMFGFTLHGLLLGLEVQLLDSERAISQGALASVTEQGEALRSLGLLCGSVIVVGIPQWLVLRSRIRRAGWWILASAVGLLLAAPDRSGGTYSLVVWVAFTMLAGGVYGIVTAFALYFMVDLEQIAEPAAESD
jgi:hypothetical protein